MVRADQTFYSFAATLIPGLLFGTVRAALTPRTVTQLAQDLLDEMLPDAKRGHHAGFRAGWEAYTEAHPPEGELLTEDEAAKRAMRRAMDESFKNIVEERLEPESRAEAATRLRRQGAAIVLAVFFSLAAEGAALYGAIVGNPSGLIRDSVVVAVLVGMTSAALAAFWPWIRHLSMRYRAISGIACALALALSAFLVIYGFSQHQSDERTLCEVVHCVAASAGKK
jgi:hypothetical protein